MRVAGNKTNPWTRPLEKRVVCLVRSYCATPSRGWWTGQGTLSTDTLYVIFT